MGKSALVASFRVAEFVYELGDGDTWTPHPSGNGIIVCHPDRHPLWCRVEDNSYRQNFILPDASPAEPDLREVNFVSRA